MLDPPSPRGLYRYEVETIGVYTLLMEVGLMELHGVTAVVAGRPLSPGLARPVGEAALQRWTASLTFGDNPDALEIEFELCSSDRRRCRSTSSTGTRESPELAVAPLLQFASEVLERDPAPGAIQQWTMPVSGDPYAVLICGRSAAAWYGLVEMEENEEGKKEKDQISRAVFLDPSNPLAQWLLARRYALEEKWTKSMPHFAAAREGRPLAPVFLADEAMAMQAERRPAAAADMWDALLEAVPRDPRFMLARVDTYLTAAMLDEARTQLGLLYQDWPKDSGVAAARVALADKSGEEQGVDDLLAHWQETDPLAVEPVRRRILLRVRQTSYPDAWSMLPELRSRGANALADSYEIPLGVALEEWETAAKAAERIGSPDVAARIRARQAMIADPARPPTMTGALTPESHVVLGRVALRQQRAKEALDYAERAEKLRPWDPEALALTRDALSSLGNSAAAQKVARKIAQMEPPSPAVLVTTGPPR